MNQSKILRSFVFVLFLVTAVTLCCYAAQSPQRPGYVYVLSNVGSFGEGVYKIGMTEREKPELRVRELGDASVPFPFDIHVMIATDHPKELERKVHEELNDYRINKFNLKKEFFRTDLDTIVSSIKKHHDKPIEVTREPRGWEYRQSVGNVKIGQTVN